MQNHLTLKPLTFSDLDLLVTWFQQPHVKKWWPDNLSAPEIKTKYGNRIGSTSVVPLIIYAEEKPIGFLQYYNPAQVGDEWNKHELPGTRGFDIFIGDPEYLGKGYGTAALKLMINQLFARPDIKKIIVDVDPHNNTAIKTYQKVGLKFVRTAQTPEGLAHIMELEK